MHLALMLRCQCPRVCDGSALWSSTHTTFKQNIVHPAHTAVIIAAYFRHSVNYTRILYTPQTASCTVVKRSQRIAKQLIAVLG